MNRSVLIDCRMMMEKPDGIGRYLSQLVPRIIDLAPDLHFHVLRRPNPWPKYDLSGFERENVSQHLRRTRQMSLVQHLTVPWMARRLGVGLLHYPHYDAPVTLVSVPVVATIHDVKYLEHPEWYRGNWRLKNLYARWSFGQTVRRASALIAVSGYTAERVLEAFPEARTKTTVIHEAVGSGFQQSGGPNNTVAREEFDLERPFVLTVGERRPHKNHVGLIRAYAASRSCETHDLALVGSPYADYREPEDVVKELGIGDRVHFLGKVSDDDLAALYQESKLFILVSRYEGFGLPLLEAMASGTPVIASKTTATGEIAGGGALLVDPDNTVAISAAVDRLLTEKAERIAQIEKGRRWIQNFSWRKAAEETLTVYRHLLDR